MNILSIFFRGKLKLDTLVINDFSQLRLLLAQDKKTDEERVRSAFYNSDGGNKLFRKTKCKVDIFLHVTLVLI